MQMNLLHPPAKETGGYGGDHLLPQEHSHTEK